MVVYDAVIIGGGVIGLSILHSSLLSSPYNILLLERSPHLCNGASGRNSGVLCTGVDAPNGSLERALIRDSISRVREFCGGMNVPVRECGSLVCLWPWDDCDGDDCEEDEKKVEEISNDNASTIKSSRDRLKHVLQESHIAGDNDATYLSSTEVSKMEPALSSKCKGAVHIPGETVTDPFLFYLALASHSREMAKNNSRREEDVIQTGREVVMEASSFDEESGIWNIVTRKTKTAENERENDEIVTIQAKCVINAAGINSDLIQSSASSSTTSTCKTLLPPPTYEARPRRGQYAIFSAPKSSFDVPTTTMNDSMDDSIQRENVHNSQWPTVPNTIPTRPIQPVPSQFTKGIFVYSTLYDQIVVGPTAQDQSSRTDNSIDSNVRKELVDHASRILGPQFDSSEFVGEYVGIRPGTSQRDYQIQLHPTAKFITVGGIRSTGLTASLGIGRHVIQCLLPPIVPPPLRMVDDNTLLEDEMCTKKPTPLPDVKELVQQYHERGDGTIVVGGYVYKVTHPLTRMGWDAKSGLAS